MAFTTNSQTNVDIIHMAHGKLVQDAVAVGVTLTLGFAPKYFRLVNITDRITEEWFDGMAAAESLHAVAAGTLTDETSNGVTVDADARTVTLNATTMAASKTFYWVAFG